MGGNREVEGEDHSRNTSEMLDLVFPPAGTRLTPELYSLCPGALIRPGSPQGVRGCLWGGMFLWKILSPWRGCSPPHDGGGGWWGGTFAVLTVHSLPHICELRLSRGKGENESKELKKRFVGLAGTLAVIGHKIYIL